MVGARDLDGDTLRRSFRDFVQKAQASGPDTVAMVYLAGYGIQLAGENYFIPVTRPSGATPTFRPKPCGSATMFASLARCR